MHNIHRLAWASMLVGPLGNSPACPCVKTALLTWFIRYILLNITVGTTYTTRVHLKFLVGLVLLNLFFCGVFFFFFFTQALVSGK